MNTINQLLTRGIITAQVKAFTFKTSIRNKLQDESGSLSAETAAMIVVAIVIVGIALKLASDSMKNSIAPGVDGKINEFFNFN